MHDDSPYRISKAKVYHNENENEFIETISPQGRRFSKDLTKQCNIILCFG